jgi:hypothetical protein
MTQRTNILALPLVTMDVVTGNNEDWIDAVTYVVSDGTESPDVTTLPQMDLRGIQFDMEVRRRPTDHEVILEAATWNQRLQLGAFPNYGYLIIAVPIDQMKTKMAGAYVADVIANDGVYAKKTIQMNLTIVEGITK